jgi:purine nucleosidase
MTQKIVLDCDTGIDDTMALLYAALHPAIDLLAVGSVWGNVDVDLATRNNLHTLAMVGRTDVPVAKGAAGPSNGGPAELAYHVHGDDGQGNAGTDMPVGRPTDMSAAEQLVQVVRSHPGEVHIVAVGPLTNVAQALDMCAELPGLVHGVTVMGGAALAPGNVTPVAEANIWHDPEAAAAVFDAQWPLTMVGLDVTMRTTLDEGHRTNLSRGGTIGQYMSRILDFYFDFFAATSFGERRGCLHDTMAVAVAARTLVPDLAPTVHAVVDTSDGPGRGQTICDLRGMYMGFPAQDGAHCTVVLQAAVDFADDVVALIAGAGDSVIDVEPRTRTAATASDDTAAVRP